MDSPPGGSQADVGTDTGDTAPIPDERVTIAVAGDLIVDWILTVSREALPPSPIVAQPRGAALLSELLKAAYRSPELKRPGKVITIEGAELPREALRQPHFPAVTRLVSVWQPYPAPPLPPRNEPRMVWRMGELIARQPAETTPASPDPSPPDGEAAPESAPHCLVLDDDNLTFRRRPGVWPRSLRGQAPKPAHVVLRMSSPFAQGPLWRRLTKQFSQPPATLTVCCSVDDLRYRYAAIGQSLSWERTGADVVKALTGEEYLKQLVRAARVVVWISTAGAVLMEPEADVGRLIFDPRHQEGDWERRRPGMPIEVGTCLAAALAMECADQTAKPDWVAAIGRGLETGRVLHEHGLSLTDDSAPDGLRFPLAAMARALMGIEVPGPSYHNAPVSTDDAWRLFAPGAPGGTRPAAERLAVHGVAEAGSGVPIERIGKWVSIDHTEIESMRSVRSAITGYLSQSSPPRPLNLAVFGRPGTGKSFAIKEMASELKSSGVKMEILEFNLSQFSGSIDLSRALQRIRDCAVNGALPLVFWDEFDTKVEDRELGWLVRFLAPMQDGSFTEDGVVRPIGPAIFVFAGGTSWMLSDFKKRAERDPATKATDFLSRIRGFVNVLGPNPEPAGQDPEPAGPDRTYMLRRALLLRSMLRPYPQLFRDGLEGRLAIDPGVLRAFLQVDEYFHGARSMEAVIAMSALVNARRYTRSALPAKHQLGLHVDAAGFLRLVEGTSAGAQD